MRRNLVLFFLIIISANVFGQSGYGNEWIKENQKYIKIKVSEDGVYRISHAQLLSIGFLGDNPNPKNFQIFYRGVEIPLHVEGKAITYLKMGISLNLMEKGMMANLIKYCIILLAYSLIPR